MSKVSDSYRVINANNGHQWDCTAENVADGKIRVTIKPNNTNPSYAGVEVDLTPDGSEEDISYSEHLCRAVGSLKWDKDHNVVRFKGYLMEQGVGEIHWINSPLIAVHILNPQD